MASKRKPYDFYPTPRKAIMPFLDWCMENGYQSNTVLDPCAGYGAILESVRDRFHGCRLIGYEIRGEARPPYVKEGDWTTMDSLLHNQLEDYPIITNPPYTLAKEFIDKFSKTAEWSAWLVRLSFLGSQDRAPWFELNRPKHVCILPKRPSFTGGGTDNSEYCWIVYDNVSSEKTTNFHWLKC